jgi:hypothetical protein
MFLIGVNASAQQASEPPDTVIIGEVEVVQEDTLDGKGDKLYHVITDKKTRKSYWLEFEKEPKHPLKSGMVVKAKGKIRGDEFVVKGGDSGSTTIEADSLGTTGQRAIAVIIVNFKDTNPPSTAAVAQIMWPDPAQNYANANVSDLYAEASGGLVEFDPDTDGNGAPDVFGPFTVNAYSTDSCNYYSWAYDAEAQASAAGVNLGNYQHLLFVLPTSNTCNWVGVANVGCGTQCRAWVVGTKYPDAYAHELGHNLSMRHASTDTNNDGVTDNAYGDKSDIMGYSGVGYRHPNAAHKEQMGWYSGFSGRIQNVQQSGTFTVAPLELFPWETNLPQIVKIYKADTKQYYYLSYRLRSGYDSNLGSGYVERLNVHRYSGSGSVETYFIKALSDGQVFEDTKNGIKVTQRSHNADPALGSVTFDVTFGPAYLPPSVSISPSSQSTNTPGSAVQYAVNVTNNDPNGAATTFSFAKNLPSGWTASAEPAQIALNPGQSGSMTATVTPPSTVSDGTYSLSLGAADPSGAHATVTATATYSLDSTPPLQVTGLKASVDKKGIVTLSWNATSDGSGTGVGNYHVYRGADSSPLTYVGSVTGTQYKDSGLSAGSTYTYAVLAEDRAGNQSAMSSSVSVSISSKTSSPGRPQK